MGILGAIGAGLGAAAGGVADVYMKDILATIETDRAKALDTFRADRRLADEETLSARAESRRKGQIDAYEADLKGATTLQSDGMINVDATDQAEYRRLNPLSEQEKRSKQASAGLISMGDAERLNSQDRKDEETRNRDSEKLRVAEKKVDLESATANKRLDNQHDQVMGRLGAAGKSKDAGDDEGMTRDDRDEVAHLRKRNGKLEDENAKREPEKYNTQEAYDAAYKKVEDTIAANDKRIKQLKGGGSDAAVVPTKSLDELAAPDKKAKTKDAAPAPKPKATAGASSSVIDKIKAQTIGSEAELTRAERVVNLTPSDKDYLAKLRKGYDSNPSPNGRQLPRVRN